MAAIRAGVADAISGAIADLQVSAYYLSNPTLPCAYVMPGAIEYDIAMAGGGDDVALVVRLLMPATSDIGQQKNLDQFCASTGAKSIKAAIEADDTLGGVVDWVRVTGCSEPTAYVPENGPPAFGVDFALTAYTSSSHA